MSRRLFALLLVPTLSCVSVSTTQDVKYSETAKGNYEAALKAMKRGNYEDATKYFEEVRLRYPYTVYAALSDLGLADADFERQRFPEAAEGYRAFVRLHPAHPKIPYAEFRIGEAYFKDIPSNLFIFPDPSEKDQASARDAYRTLGDFLRDFPDSEYVPKATELRKKVRALLARHEMAVADFYIRRDKWGGAIERLRTLIDTYPGDALEGDAMWKLANAQVSADKKDEAKRTLEAFLEKFPNSPHTPGATALMKKLP